jgi:hypothetical protein
MTDAMMKAKLAVLEHDILQAAQSDPVKQMGVISVTLEDKIRLAASLKRQLSARHAAATTPVAPPRSSRITIAT